MENKTYNQELETLKRERIIREQVVDAYKNRLISELLAGEAEIVHEVKETKKSFWKRLFSAL